MALIIKVNHRNKQIYQRNRNEYQWNKQQQKKRKFSAIFNE